MNTTLSFHLDPYLAQWFIHEQGGDNPVHITRGSAESDILELFLTTRPKDKSGLEPDDDGELNVTIALPNFKHKDTRDNNYMPPRALLALKHAIRVRFLVQLYKELFTIKNFDLQKKELIWAFMEAHGIEFTDTNWRAIDKIYLRKRNAEVQRQCREKKSKIHPDFAA